MANVTENSYKDLRCDVAWAWRDKTEIIFHDGSYDLSAELCTVSYISCYSFTVRKQPHKKSSTH